MDDIKRMLEDCFNAKAREGCPFAEWEISALETIQEQFLGYGYLFPEQLFTLKGLWLRV